MYDFFNGGKIIWNSGQITGLVIISGELYVQGESVHLCSGCELRVHGGGLYLNAELTLSEGGFIYNIDDTIYLSNTLLRCDSTCNSERLQNDGTIFVYNDFAHVSVPLDNDGLLKINGKLDISGGGYSNSAIQFISDDSTMNISLVSFVFW